MHNGTWADDNEARHRLPPLHRPSNSGSDDSYGYGQFDNRYDEDYYENEANSSDFSSGRGGYPLVLTTNSLSNIVFQNSEPDNEKYQKMLLKKQKRASRKEKNVVNVFKPEDMMNFNGELDLDALLQNLGEEIELKKKVTKKSWQGEKMKAKKIKKKSSLTEVGNASNAVDGEAKDAGLLWSEAEDEETASVISQEAVVDVCQDVRLNEDIITHAEVQSPIPYVKVKSKKQRSRSNIISQEDKRERNSFVDGIMSRKPNSSQVFSVTPKKESNSRNEIVGLQTKLNSDWSQFSNELVTCTSSNIVLPSGKAENQVKSQEFVEGNSEDLVEEFNIELRAEDFPALPSYGNKIEEALLEIPSQSRKEKWFRPWVKAVTQSIPCPGNEKLQDDQGFAAVMNETTKSTPENVNVSQNLSGGNIENGETLYETETIDAYEFSSNSGSISCSMENIEVSNASEISTSSSVHKTNPCTHEDSKLLIPPAHSRTPVQFVREKPEDCKGAGEIIFGFEPNPVLVGNCHSPALVPLLPAHCWPSLHYIPVIPVPNLLLSVQPELPHQLPPQLVGYPEPPPVPEVSPPLARLPTPWHSTLDTRSVHSYDSAEPEQEEQEDQPTSDSGLSSSPSRKSSSGSSVTESAGGPANSTNDKFNLGEIVSFVQGNWSSVAQDDTVQVFTVAG